MWYSNCYVLQTKRQEAADGDGDGDGDGDHEIKE